MTIFKNDATQKAFEAWISPFNGIQIHPLDDERFYSFVKQYCLNGENVSRDVFSKEAKRYTRTTKTYKKGICQKYYDKLFAINAFVKAMKIQL
jgi:hypothetical protein